MGLVRGLSSVVIPHWSAINDSELRPLLDNGIHRDEPRSEVIPEILALRQLVESDYHLPDPSSRLACSDAIETLHDTVLKIRGIETGRSALALLFSWPVQVSNVFMKSLSAREPVSLIILAHFAATFPAGGNAWWLGQWDKTAVSSVEQTLPAHLRYRLVWPKNVCFDDTL